MSKFRAFCKEWLTWLSQQIFQYTCPVCRTTTLYERGICPGCLAMLAVEEKRTCPRCHHIAPECTCALSVPTMFPMGDKDRTWLAHTFYDSYEDGVLRKLLHNAKKDYKRAMFDYMASMLVADLNKMYQSGTHAMAFGDAALRGFRAPTRAFASMASIRARNARQESPGSLESRLCPCSCNAAVKRRKSCLPQNVGRMPSTTSICAAISICRRDRCCCTTM